MQNYYRIRITLVGGSLHRLIISDRQGVNLGVAVIPKTDDSPKVLLDGLKQLGQRFVGSLPPLPRGTLSSGGSEGIYQEYWVVTEPIPEAAKAADNPEESRETIRFALGCDRQ